MSYKNISLSKALFAFLVILLTALAPPLGWTFNREIHQKEYGDSWPLTVPETRLFCEGNMVFVLVNDVYYPLNGRAKSQLRTRRPAWTVRPLKDIWKFRDAEFDIRVSISPLIDDGLKLCQ